MSEKALVLEAIKDLKKELAILERKKGGLNKSLEDARHAIKSDQKKELELRKSISLLANEEVKLSEKKTKTLEKLENLKEKLAKISKISSELEEV